MPILGRLRWKDHPELAASLSYRVNFRPAWTIVLRTSQDKKLRKGCG